MKLEQERLAEEKEWTVEELLEHFQRWAQNSKVRDSICGNYLSPEEREARMREIFGLPATNGHESNPIKPSQSGSNQIKPDEGTDDT